MREVCLAKPITTEQMPMLQNTLKFISEKREPPNLLSRGLSLWVVLLVI